MPSPARPFPTRTASLIAGLSLLAMAVIAAIANFGVVEPLLAADPPDLAASASTLRLGVLGFTAIVVLDVIVSIALFAVFETNGRWLSITAAAFRLVYSAVFLAGIAQLSSALLPGADAAASAAAFSGTWDVALTLFGIHLVLIGVLAWRSSLVPRVIAVLVGIAGAGYLVDAVAVVGFGVELGSVKILFVGEVALLVVLIVQGLRRAPRVAAASTPVAA